MRSRRGFLTDTVRAGVGLAALGSAAETSLAAPKGGRLVVLTFDDAVATHRTFVAPLLKELGFGATFFVTHRWMADDPRHYMTWRQIAEIHHMGFEIGNHSWTHPDFSHRRDAARLAAELAPVEQELAKVDVPRPASFAWCGNRFCPEAVQELSKLRYQFARRGMQPEVPFGRIEVGPTFDPEVHHHLLIPSTGDAYPGWTLAHFQRVVERARDGKPVVLQFHGVPDVHPWVDTPPERFREYMAYLKTHDFRVIPLRDLKELLPERPPADPLLKTGFPEMKQARGEWPTETRATATDLG